MALGLVLMIGVSGASAKPSTSRFATVALGKGEDAAYSWGVYGHRDKGKGGAKRPCITVALLHRDGKFVDESDAVVCKALPSNGPFLVLSESAGEGKSQFSVFGLAYALRISKVTLGFAVTGPKTVQLHKLSQQQSRKSGLRPFRYGAFALRGESCLEEVTGFNSSGQIVYHHFLRECPGPEEARQI